MLQLGCAEQEQGGGQGDEVRACSVKERSRKAWQEVKMKQSQLFEQSMNWPEAHACQQHRACQARHAIPRSGERSLDAAREISASAVGIFLREKLLARLGTLPPACKAWSIS